MLKKLNKSGACKCNGSPDPVGKCFGGGVAVAFDHSPIDPAQEGARVLGIVEVPFQILEVGEDLLQ